MREGAENANVELGAMLAVVVLLAVIRVVGAFGPDDSGNEESADLITPDVTTEQAITPPISAPTSAPDSTALPVSSPEALAPAIASEMVAPEPEPETATAPEPVEEAPRSRLALPRLSDDLVPELDTPSESDLLSGITESVQEPVRVPAPAQASPPPAPAPRPAPVTPPRSAEPEIFETVEQMPVLQGGLPGLQRRIRYPDLARRMGVEGRVFVQFIVNEDGSVANVRTVRGIGAGCDEAAEAAVRASRFSPGRQRGRLVKVRMTLPVTFRAN